MPSTTPSRTLAATAAAAALCLVLIVLVAMPAASAHADAEPPAGPGAGASPAVPEAPEAPEASAPGAPEVADAPADPAVAPMVHTPLPTPGAIVVAGEAALGARVRSPHAVTSAVLSVDGAPVDEVRVEQPASGGDAVVSGRFTAGPGDHVARLRVEDAGGGSAERSWRFHATYRHVTRLAAADRFATAAAISTAAFPSDGGAGHAVLARGDDFADALAGVPLAAAFDGPLLLAAPDALPEATAEELARVLAPGATVHLLGGEAALGATVAADVEDLGLRVLRHAGRDRFATAAAVARLLPPSAGVIVASGESFPDALTASAPAARDGLPILLTAAGHLPEATADALARRETATATIVGGPAAVSERVEARAAGLVARVQRVAGPDRAATAAAVLEAFYDAPMAVSLAGGETFPDALAGAVHAGALAQPLLLVSGGLLPTGAAESLRRHRPEHITVYGGPAAVGDDVLAAALRAAVDGEHAPRVTATTPVRAGTVTSLEAVTVTLNRLVDPVSSGVHVTLGGLEVAGAIEETGPTSTLTVRLPEDPEALPFDVAHPGRIVVYASDGDGGVGHDEVPFTYAVPDPVFATVGGISLHLPSAGVEMVGYHQSSHDGARQLTVLDTATRTVTLPGRGRGTGSRTAADVVADPDLPVVSPVTGRVVRGGSYPLYCDHWDDFVVIDPDERPGWEVKILHFRGLRVGVGDRVVAQRTVLGDGPRVLPFRSQVDRFSGPRNWPHVHIEVVDPSIPDRPGSGC